MLHFKLQVPSQEAGAKPGNSPEYKPLTQVVFSELAYSLQSGPP